MPIIQVSNTYQDDVLKIVRGCAPEGFNVRTLEANSEEELMARIGDAEYLLASGRVKINRSVLAQAKKLKMIQRTGVGLDALDLDAIREKGLPLYVNQGVNAQSVAEHALLLILACLKKLTLIDSSSKKGIWKSKEQAIQTYELCGKTVGIIGLGSIGCKVAQMLNAFGARVVYYDFYRRSGEEETALGVEYCSLEELYPQADIITLHCPLLPDTRELINEDTIAKMKDGVIIINTARGGLIKDSALLQALETGKVSFAGLDVHGEEPFKPDNKLVLSDHVIATPHIAGVSYDAFSKMMTEAMRNIQLFEKGETEAIEQYRLV